MHWPIPRAPDARVFAFGGPLLALLNFVAVQGLAGELLVAVLALVGQLRDRLLHRQVTSGRALGDFHAAIRTGRCLIAQSMDGEMLNHRISYCGSLSDL